MPDNDDEDVAAPHLIQTRLKGQVWASAKRLHGPVFKLQVVYHAKHGTALDGEIGTGAANENSKCHCF